MQNPSVQATALNVFNENYGNAAQAAIEDAASLQEGAAPIHVREYVDETMRFLVGNLQAKSDESGTKIKPMPSFSTFNPSNYAFYGEMGQALQASLWQRDYKHARPVDKRRRFQHDDQEELRPADSRRS